MIKIENTEVVGWEHAIRGMRNPMNSWDKSDTIYMNMCFCDESEEAALAEICGGRAPIIKDNDHKLMMQLAKGGPVHGKFRRMITVYLDITAPLYWWKEFDTYKVGTVANSCSTMHKIHAKEFTLEDFSHEHLSDASKTVLSYVIDELNMSRERYLSYDELSKHTKDKLNTKYPQYKKNIWWQMIQLLPTSYNQERTVMLNYEVLHNIYESRKNHKLDEWRTFCDWIEGLPYSEVITMK